MKRVFLTGASSGIGHSLAKKIAKRGGELFLLGRDQESLNQLQEELSTLTKVDIFPGDLHSSTYLEQLKEIISSDSFDTIINNAGYGLYGSFHNLSLEDQINEIEVDVKTLVFLTHVGVKTMLQKKIAGTILNVSSLASFFSTPGMAIYGASKAFVTSFSQAINYELRNTSVDVLVSCPGMVDTKFATRASRGRFLSASKWAMKQDYAADCIIKQIESKKALSVFDEKAIFMQKIASFLPKSWLNRMVYNSIKERSEV